MIPHPHNGEPLNTMPLPSPPDGHMIDAHQTDEEGFHDPEDCDVCIEQNESFACDRRCGRCCQEMLIETNLRDAEREPRIAAECSPLISDFTGIRETIGYLLNDPAKNYTCHFLDGTTKLCVIYHTRPLVCRVFDCRDHPLPPG